MRQCEHSIVNPYPEGLQAFTLRSPGGTGLGWCFLFLKAIRYRSDFSRLTESSSNQFLSIQVHSCCRRIAPRRTPSPVSKHQPCGVLLGLPITLRSDLRTKGWMSKVLKPAVDGHRLRNSTGCQWQAGSLPRFALTTGGALSVRQSVASLEVVGPLSSSCS